MKIKIHFSSTSHRGEGHDANSPGGEDLSWFAIPKAFKPHGGTRPHAASHRRAREAQSSDRAGHGVAAVADGQPP